MKPHTVIEVHSPSENLSRQSPIISEIREQTDKVIKITNESVVSRYEQYGKYPDREIIDSELSHNLIVVSAIEIPEIHSLVFLDGEMVDIHQDNFDDLNISSYLNTEYGAKTYIEKYIEERKDYEDDIRCELSLQKNHSFEDVSGGNIHIESTYSGKIKIIVREDDGNILSKSKLTRQEASQLVREIEEESDINEYPSKFDGNHQT